MTTEPDAIATLREVVARTKLELGYLPDLIEDLSKANSYELTTTECRALARMLAAAVLAAEPVT